MINIVYNNTFGEISKLWKETRNELDARNITQEFDENHRVRKEFPGSP